MLEPREVFGVAGGLVCVLAAAFVADVEVELDRACGHGNLPSQGNREGRDLTMPHVRNRLAPASKEYARKRAAANRVALAPDPAAPGGRFNGALDWLRAAAVYASRRTYRTEEIRCAALARRERILSMAAAVIQEHACRMDAVVPPSPRRSSSRIQWRGGYARAADGKQQMEAARVWFMFMARQAERAGGPVAAQAAQIEDETAARLIEWAEEMDADDYGE